MYQKHITFLGGNPSVEPQILGQADDTGSAKISLHLLYFKPYDLSIQLFLPNIT